MNLAKLGKKLRREATASPKKAALLGLGALVAAYFWAPLILGWIGKEDTGVVATAVAQSTPAATTTPPASSAGQAATENNKPTRPSWPQLAQWMESDPRTMTAPALTSTRDPFESAAAVAAEAEVVEQPKAPPPPVVTPAAAGLVLSSTIIGPQRRIAQINGKIYSVGQSIVVAKEKEPVTARFTLIEVGPRRVVLESNGQRFDLLIPEPGQSSQMEIVEGN